MNKEKMLLELLKNVKEINKKLDKLEEERIELVNKLLENDMKLIATYEQLAKLEPTVEVLLEIEIDNFEDKLELLGKDLN